MQFVPVKNIWWFITYDGLSEKSLKINILLFSKFYIYWNVVKTSETQLCTYFYNSSISESKWEIDYKIISLHNKTKFSKLKECIKDFPTVGKWQFGVDSNYVANFSVFKKDQFRALNSLTPAFA